MRYPPLSQSFYKRNRSDLRERVEDQSLVVLFSNDEMPRNGDQFYPFRQQSDLFYLTGIDQEQTICIITKGLSDKQFQEILFIKKSSKETEQWNGKKLTSDQAKLISGIDTILYEDRFDLVLHQLMTEAQNVYLNSNEYPKFRTDVLNMQDRFNLEVKKRYPMHSYSRLAPLMHQLRVVKQASEIDRIREACEITKESFYKVLSALNPGIYEYEIEAELIHTFLKRGASGAAYPPIVASGANACILHYVDNDKVCVSGDLLLLDFGAEYGNYAADCSRTVPVNGSFSNRQREVYESVLRIFKAARELFVPGNTIKIVNQEVAQLMEAELVKLGLLTKKEIQEQSPASPAYMKYYMHGTSHFMGLDVHDPGGKDLPFEKGMVLTCEPGIYIEEEGIGVRIENDILVDNVPIDLMENIPLEIEEIESLMNSNKK